MRDPDVKKTEATETRQQSGERREAKQRNEQREDKRDDKRRDTLTDENPLIFRGLD